MLRWIGHVLRHDGLLHEIIEGRMKGKPRRGRRRIEMLHDLANDGGFVALKQAAEDRERWRHRAEQKTTEKACFRFMVLKPCTVYDQMSAEQKQVHKKVLSAVLTSGKSAIVRTHGLA